MALASQGWISTSINSQDHCSLRQFNLCAGGFTQHSSNEYIDKSYWLMHTLSGISFLPTVHEWTERETALLLLWSFHLLHRLIPVSHCQPCELTQNVWKLCCVSFHVTEHFLQIWCCKQRPKIWVVCLQALCGSDVFIYVLLLGEE